MNYLAKTIHSLILLLVFSLTAGAQVGRIQETTLEVDDRRVDALVVNLKPERKEVQDAFDDWMKDRYDANMKGGGLFSSKETRRAEDIIIPAISGDRINLRTRTEEQGDESRMYLYADRGGNFIDRGDYRAFTGLENIFDSFLSFYLPEYYEERVAEAQEELSDLQDDLEDNEKDYRKNEEEIADLQEENRELLEKREELSRKIQDAERALRERESMRSTVGRELLNNNRMK